MPHRSKLTSDAHEAAQLLRGLKKEVEQLHDRDEAEDVQLFRMVEELVTAGELSSATVHDGSAALFAWDDDTQPGWDFGEWE